MENESNISFGGTIILLALFAQKYIFGQRYCHFARFNREPFLYSTVILHCMKRAQNKCKIGQWRLLFSLRHAIILQVRHFDWIDTRHIFRILESDGHIWEDECHEKSHVTYVSDHLLQIKTFHSRFFDRVAAQARLDLNVRDLCYQQRRITVGEKVWRQRHFTSIEPERAFG